MFFSARDESDGLPLYGHSVVGQNKIGTMVSPTQKALMNVFPEELEYLDYISTTDVNEYIEYVSNVLYNHGFGGNN